MAFTCLLRVDEALRIEHRHIVVHGGDILELTLDYRKTAQSGSKYFANSKTLLDLTLPPDIKPFFLHRIHDPDKEHLCVVRAFADYVNATQIASGFLFRKLDVHDRVIMQNEPMVSVPSHLDKSILDSWF